MIVFVQGMLLLRFVYCLYGELNWMCGLGRGFVWVIACAEYRALSRGGSLQAVGRTGDSARFCSIIICLTYSFRSFDRLSCFNWVCIVAYAALVNQMWSYQQYAVHDSAIFLVSLAPIKLKQHHGRFSSRESIGERCLCKSKRESGLPKCRPFSSDHNSLFVPKYLFL